MYSEKEEISEEGGDIFLETKDEPNGLSIRRNFTKMSFKMIFKNYLRSQEGKFPNFPPLRCALVCISLTIKFNVNL